MKRKQTFWFVMAFLLTIGFLVAYSQHRDLWARYQEYRDSDHKVKETQAQVQHLNQQLEESRRRIDSIDTDNVESEAIVRRIKGHVRPGEKIYKVTPAPDAGAEGEGESAQ